MAQFERNALSCTACNQLLEVLGGVNTNTINGQHLVPNLTQGS